MRPLSGDTNMVNASTANQKSVEWWSGRAQDAAVLKREGPSSGPRESRDPIRANCETVIRITKKALNIADGKKNR